MNYSKHYNMLIDRAKNRITEEYTEKHHIIPKCVDGTDDKSNLVRLTAREHFIAHQLLVKMYPQNGGLIKAVQMMCIFSTHRDRSCNRMYGWLREKFSVEMSRSQKGTGNSQFGTMWIFSEEKKVSIKIKKDEFPAYEELGWLKGRKIKFDKQKAVQKNKICIKCGSNKNECKHPEICKNHQRINTFIKYLDFDKSVLGTKLFYTEYFRVVSVLDNLYNKDMLSIEDIKVKYGFTSNERVRMMFKSLNIKRRNISEALVNYRSLVQ